ncbi:MAG: 2Fe-2S iron-sulfur cluster binding domain-containing protein [Planctomycetota bacterium]|nr:MAG: 2Fe-2S iron-sulfur cluster binding domain-containing protein [Planctomycetota bacterium]
MRDPRDESIPQANGSGVNRRDFLRGSGAAVAVTALATSEQGATAQDTAKKNVVSAKVQDVTLNVNGKDHKLSLEPRVTLLDALRDDLNLTGCKDVCDTTNCGACTVLIDGKATYACSRLAHECAGKKVTTIESLAANDPVVAGFVKHDAQQCGFCTPGFVMATKAFCDKNPGATLDQVRKGLGGNICRCGTYVGITACAMELVKKGGK